MFKASSGLGASPVAWVETLPLALVLAALGSGFGANRCNQLELDPLRRYLHSATQFLVTPQSLSSALDIVDGAVAMVAERDAFL